MDAQSIISLAQLLLAGIFALVCLNLYLILRLKEIDPFERWQPDNINGWMWLGFTIVGFAAAIISSAYWEPRFLLMKDPASEHGVEIDRMMRNTMWVSILVVLITNPLLFYYAWKYRHREGRRALYYPHNNRLELIWTLVPAVVLTLLVLDGAIVWRNVMMVPAPADALQVEINGKQFAWTVRYPGSDLEFGETRVNLINEGKGNTLGFNMEDKRGYDDLVVQELVLPVNQTVNLNIRSRDVLHNPSMPHFRVKMDAVPGMTTEFKFKPTVTTAEMREKLNNPEFNYEVACQQICGGGHWSMRLEVKVVTMEEYKQWVAQQKTFIAQYNELNGPAPAPNTAEAQPAAEGQLSMN